MTQLPTLETERLILRAPELHDLDRWAEMMTDPNATRYIGGVQPRSMVWRALMTMIGAWHSTGISMFSVLDKTRSIFWIDGVNDILPMQCVNSKIHACVCSFKCIAFALRIWV